MPYILQPKKRIAKLDIGVGTSVSKTPLIVVDQQSASGFDMPYFITEAKCVCGSGENIFECHGNYDPGNNLAKRCENLIYNITKNHDEYYLLSTFNSLDFRKIRFSFMESMKISRETTALCLEMQMDPHLIFESRTNLQSVIPEAVPPEVLFYLIKKVEWNDDEGSLIMNPGLYRVSPESWGHSGGGVVEGNLTFKSEDIKHIIENGEGKLKKSLNIRLLWNLIQRKMGVVKSVVLLDTEIIRHTAA